MAEDYIVQGFAVSFVLDALSFPRSSYYSKKEIKFFLVGKPPKRTRGFCNKRDGTMISDIELEEILLEIFYFDDPYDPRYYLKVLGSKKLSKYLRNELGMSTSTGNVEKHQSEIWKSINDFCEINDQAN